MDMEFISIVTPMYNGGRFVAQTIESVLAQTYPHWEMLIVDDGSKDDSPETVGAYSARDPRIKLIRQPNSGSAAARNNALRRARGRYICFLDADDLWDPEFLARQIAFIQEKAAGLVYASYRRINECGDEILRPFIVPERVDYKGLLKTCSISCLTAFFDRTKIGEVFFDESLHSMRDDFVFWLGILRKIDCAYGNPDVLASYRVFGTSTTGNKKRVMKPQFMVYYKVEKLGFFRSVYYFLHWAVNGYFKYR